MLELIMTLTRLEIIYVFIIFLKMSLKMNFLIMKIYFEILFMNINNPKNYYFVLVYFFFFFLLSYFFNLIIIKFISKMIQEINFILYSKGK